MLRYVTTTQTLNLISVSFLSCLLVVTESVTIYSWVYLRNLRQLNSQFYIPGLLLQLKLKKVLLSIQANFIMENLFGLSLDTVFCFEEFSYITHCYFVVEESLLYSQSTQGSSTWETSQELGSFLTQFFLWRNNPYLFHLA